MAFIAPLARLLFSLVFLYQGIFYHLMNHTEATIFLTNKGVAMASAITYVTGFLIILMGIGIMFGFYTRFCGSVLAIYLVITALFLHNPFSVPAVVFRAEMLALFKDLGLAAGGLLFAYFGAGPYSIDKEG